MLDRKDRLRPLTFRPGYALMAAIVFAVEVVIALFVRDDFVRPHFGDVLAVILVYLALRAVLPLRVIPAAGVAFLIAAAIEAAQGLNLIDHLGLRDNALARTVLGAHFDTRDFAAYASGAVIAIAIEALRKQRMI